MNKHELALYAFIALMLLFVWTTPAAMAQLTAVPGQGLHPVPVIGGDVVPPPSVPTGSNLSLGSSIFPIATRQIPLTIYLRAQTYSHNTHQSMGKRTVLTIRTNTLNPMQMDLIAGILQLSSNSALGNGEHATHIDVSDYQLEQIDRVLVPQTHNQQESTQTWLFHYLPVARKFCQWTVLLGVVFATVMLSIAAYGLVMSHRGSADKIISTVAGLVVLLMAYTIYSLLIANAGNNHSSASVNQILQSSPQP